MPGSIFLMSLFSLFFWGGEFMERLSLFVKDMPKLGKSQGKIILESKETVQRVLFPLYSMEYNAQPISVPPFLLSPLPFPFLFPSVNIY